MGGVLSCFQGLLGVVELTIMGDCYDLYSKDSGFTISMCLRNFESNILRVWFKLKKMFSFLTLFKHEFCNVNVSLYSKIRNLSLKFTFDTSTCTCYNKI